MFLEKPLGFALPGSGTYGKLTLEIRNLVCRFGPIEVEDFPRQRRRSVINWLQVEWDLDAMLEGTEAMSLHDAARMLGVRVNSLRIRLPAKTEELRQHSRRDTISLRGQTAKLPQCRQAGWWARLGLNQRPLRCQRSALPLSYAPANFGLRL